MNRLVVLEFTGPASAHRCCFPEELRKCLQYVVNPLIVQAWKYSNPERLIHDTIRIGQISHDPECSARHIRLTSEISREQIACGDVMLM
jgi:hypothetical protein